MDFKYKVNIVKSFLGDCLIITDTTTNSNVELMRVQANAILKRYMSGKMNGTFSHANYSINEDIISIYHDKNTKNHNIEITILDLLSILKENKGVINKNVFINEKDIL